MLNGEALIRDHTGEAHLAAGASHLIFKFSRQAILSRLSFINDGMQGKCACWPATMAGIGCR